MNSNTEKQSISLDDSFVSDSFVSNPNISNQEETMEAVFDMELREE